MTLVLEHAPQFPSHCRIVPPVAQASPKPSTAPFGFEGGEVFSTDEPTIMEQRQQDQQIGGQVRQFAVAPLILLPTGLDAGVVVGAHALLPAGEMGRQGVFCSLLGDCLLDQLHIAIPAGFEAVNLAAQARLPAINAPGIQKNRTAHLAVGPSPSVFPARDGDERPDAPIQSQDAGLLFKGRDVPGFRTEHEIEDGHAAPIIAPDFSQSGSLRTGSLPQIRAHRGGQGNFFAPCSPGPQFPSSSVTAQAEPGDCPETVAVGFAYHSKMTPLTRAR